jgi:hypothetical protein
MKTLDEIGQQYPNDRHSLSFMDYFHTYEEFCGKWRDQPVRVMEIGVFRGGGIMTWSEYFTHPEAIIVGLDVNMGLCPPISDPRVRLVLGSSGDGKVLDGLPHPLDFVIDDGGHMASDQMFAFLRLWPRLAKGGIYCVEDIWTSWSSRYSNASKTIMQFIEQIEEEMQGKGDFVLSRRTPEAPWSDVDTITIRRGLAIFRKHST